MLYIETIGRYLGLTHYDGAQRTYIGDWYRYSYLSRARLTGGKRSGLSRSANERIFGRREDYSHGTTIMATSGRGGDGDLKESILLEQTVLMY